MEDTVASVAAAAITITIRRVEDTVALTIVLVVSLAVLAVSPALIVTRRVD